ncbi:P-type DNA transfer ATPase VirB11 [Hydrogenophaga sp.]|uniref:P-type DNA transfer ATPase VirB11 n=1 Tax=Hydrogenophaga sp. TaxID=1904254 RepID=UPI00262FA029|nr:P-type DNA transfer ATPase VirB11 [Hydrogenophaga sp.]MCW5654242.1 P-type DNA transfer ATPase VirB11 [Hydrogenophaga sp.]
MSTAALLSYLAPLKPLLDSAHIEEIIVNRPREVYVESGGAWVPLEIPEFDQRRLTQLADLIATYSHQTVGARQPLLSAQLPEGQRVQVVMPPGCLPEMFGLAIRLPSQKRFSLDDLARSGSLRMRSEGHGTSEQSDAELTAMLDGGDLVGFLQGAVRLRKNILISGGTSTGKTTTMRALTDEMRSDERIVTIEDVPEISLSQHNKLSLIASKGGQGVAKVGVTDLLEASMRLRPDRILLGEIRGAEAADFLELINSGHPGSISTIHADSPRLCFERLCFMVKRREGFQAMSGPALLAYIQSVIDVVIQFKRFDNGFRGVTQVWFGPRDRLSAPGPEIT